MTDREKGRIVFILVCALCIGIYFQSISLWLATITYLFLVAQTDE